MALRQADGSGMVGFDVKKVPAAASCDRWLEAPNTTQEGACSPCCGFNWSLVINA